MFAGYYGAMALSTALISIYLIDKGYTENMVSLLIILSYVFTMVIQPMAGRLQSRYNAKTVTQVMFVIAVCGSILAILTDHLLGIIVGYCIAAMMLNAAGPYLEKASTGSSYPYRKIRIWGTIGYAASAKAAGWIYEYLSPDALYVFCAAAIILCMVGFWGTAEIPRKREEENEKPETSGSYAMFWKDKQFLLYLLIAGIFYGATNQLHTYCTSMFQSEGISVEIISTVIFMAGMAEMLIVIESHKFMNRFPNKVLLLFDLGVVTVLCGGYAFLQSPAFKMVMTCLMKNTTGMTFIMINMQIIAAMFDSKNQIEALALVNTVRSLASILFYGIAGQILVRYSYSILYLICFGCMAAAMILTFFMNIPYKSEDPMFR